MQHGAVLRRHVGRIDDVLDADRNAIQGTDRRAAASALVRCAGLRECMVFVEKLPRLDRRLDLASALEACAHELLGREQPLGHPARRLGGGKLS